VVAIRTGEKMENGRKEKVEKKETIKKDFKKHYREKRKKQNNNENLSHCNLKNVSKLIEIIIFSLNIVDIPF